MKTITACTRDCPDACSIIAELGEDGTLQLRGNPDHPVTAGAICAKTRDFGRTLRSPHRIVEPLLRTAGGWQGISWDAALDLCAGKIQELRDDPTSILHVYSAGTKGLTSQITVWFFDLLGASRAAGSLCDSAGGRAYELDFGVRDGNHLDDLLNARRIVNWGRDLSRGTLHMGMFVQQARRRGAAVLTVSPGGDDGNDAFTDERIRIRPGTDRFLAAAVIRLFIERGCIAPAVTARTHNWPAFRSLIMGLSIEELSDLCDVSRGDIERLADFYCPSGHSPAYPADLAESAASGPTATIIGSGLQRYWHGGENVRLINAVALLSGNIGRSGGGSYFTKTSSRIVNMAWAAAPHRGPGRPLYKPMLGREVLQAGAPPVRLIWVNGTNVVNQAPDARTTARAFEQAEFKIVVDAFMNDTADRADLILPCALMFEREDLVVSAFHDCVNYAAVASLPPPRARTDHWIVSELGKRLDPPVHVPSVEDIMRAALDSPVLDCSLEELKERGFVRANRPTVAFEGLRFAHADGLYRFPESVHRDPPLPAGYPLHLLSLIRGEFLHSQILPEDHPRAITAWVAPNCPGLAGVDLTRPVYLASPLGRLKVEVQFMPGLHPGAVLCRRGTWMKLGGGVNELIAGGLTDIGDCATNYSHGVRLEN